MPLSMKGTPMDVKPIEAKSVLFVCSGKTCEKEGSGKIYDALRELVRSSGEKNQIEVHKCECLGPCKKGPNVYAFPSGTMITGAKAKHADKILAAALADQ